MRFSAMTIVVLLSLVLIVSDGKAEEQQGFYAALHVASGKTVKCTATYHNWYAVKIDVERISVFLSGISIEPGLIFEKTDKTASRVCIEAQKVPFGNNGKLSVVLSAIALDDGLFKGELGDVFNIRTSGLAREAYVVDVCKALRENKNFTLSAGQAAIWMKKSDLSFGHLARWRVYPADTPLFSVMDATRGMLLAERLGVDVAKQSGAKDVSILVVGLRDDFGDAAEWCRTRLVGLGFAGESKIEVARKVFENAEWPTNEKAAGTLAVLGETAPLLAAAKDKERDLRHRALMLDFYVSVTDIDTWLPIFEPFISENWRSFAPVFIDGLKGVKDTEFRFAIVRRIIDDGRKEDLRFVDVCETRNQALNVIIHSKLPQALNYLLELLENETDQDMVTTLAINIVGREEPRALPILEKLAANTPSEVRRKWFLLMVDSLRKKLQK